jgi:hypothetical protein
MRNWQDYRHTAWLAVGLLATAALAGGDAPAARKPATIAVRGIEGIKGPKLINLEQALQLQRHAPPPPAAASPAPLFKGPPGPPPPDPPPPTDERVLLEEIPPDRLGGS